MSKTTPALNVPSVGFMRLSQVLKIIPVGKTLWYAGVKEGRFPQPVKLGPRTAAYRVQDITALIERLGQNERVA